MEPPLPPAPPPPPPGPRPHWTTWACQPLTPPRPPARVPQTLSSAQGVLTLPGTLLWAPPRKEGKQPTWEYKGPFPMVLWAHLHISHEPQPTRK